MFYCDEHVYVPANFPFNILYTAEYCTEDTFQLYEDTNANGAKRDASANTVEECKSSCLGNSNCVGFDFNTINDQCWIHTDTEAISEDNRNTGSTGVNLYVRVECGEYKGNTTIVHC